VGVPGGYLWAWGTRVEPKIGGELSACSTNAVVPSARYLDLSGGAAALIFCPADKSPQPFSAGLATFLLQSHGPGPSETGGEAVCWNPLNRFLKPGPT